MTAAVGPERRVGVFCDFDGTISERDLIAAIALQFGGEGVGALIDAVQHGALSVQAGVEAMFSSIASERLAEIIDYARARTVVRNGFGAFVDDALARGWLFAVVSGGFDFFVQPVVEPFGDRIRVFCNRLEADGAFLHVVWGVPCEDGCGLCKPEVLRRCRGEVEQAVVVGDGVTDLKAARQADLVVARDRLRAACEREGIPHLPLLSFDGLAERIDAALQAGGCIRL